MSSPLQFLSHSDPGRLATGQTKEPREAKPSEARHQPAPTAQKNPPGVPSRNPNMYNKRAADPARPELAGLLVKNKNLLAELRNLQNKLFAKETSLREMQSELESYRENNLQQTFQIMSLKEDIKDLQELIASLSRIKSLKNTNIQSLERGNWDLTERIIGLENSLRIHLVEREKAERKADLLEKKLSLSDASRFTPYLNTKGQEDSLDIFAVKDKGEAPLAKNFERDIFHSEGPKDGQKIWEKCQQDLIHKEKQTPESDSRPGLCARGTDAGQSQYQQLLSQLATLLSDSVGPIAATEDAVKERIQEIGANEQSWKSRTEDLQQEIQLLTKQLAQLHPLGEDAAQEPSPREESYWEQKRPLRRLEGSIAIDDFFQRKLDSDRKKENPMGKNSQRDEHGKKFRQLEEDYKQQMLLTIRQNLQIATTQKLEEKIQKLQKQLSDLKLSNKNMKTQLTRVNALKDKTIERLRQSLTKVETMKGKAVRKTESVKTALEPAEQEARADPERARPMSDSVAAQLSAAKSSLDDVSGRERELVDFRETIMKMLGFNMKTANKEIINQLKLIIQIYEISNKPKTAPDGDSGQEKE
ncbi:coiled-coil domain-containing protein 170-like [Lepus europaeus]|uniref:coiled-coil domain-containing protein 170-like n=1 Tax=Lepus europaeus TaxID=9983 RepID=UPI002B47DFE5|nr:coiled-coil domain-containing protein 170-like [Lepus europaeus]